MAKNRSFVLEEAAPIFEGFSKETFQFLHGLKKNNQKAWFEKHRDDYEMYLRNPSKALVHSMSQYFREHKMPLDASPRSSLFRINRDIRFSSDKSPYKTHIGIVFTLKETAKEEWCGAYLGMEPAAKGKGIESYAGGGAHMPMSPFLKRIRSKISDRSKEFSRIIESDEFTDTYPAGLHGDSLKRMPQGYDEGHALARYLKLKDFTVSSPLTEADLLSESPPDILGARFRAALPLILFLGRS